MAITDRRRRLLAKFAGVARDRLNTLASLLAALLQTQDDGGSEGAAEHAVEDAAEERVTELMREIHTLKGESRLMGFGRMNILAHRTEDLLVFARAKKFQLSADQHELLIRGFDLMRRRIDDEAASEESHTQQEDEYLEALDAALSGEAAPPSPKGDSAEPQAGTAAPAPAAPAPSKGGRTKRAGGEDRLGPGDAPAASASAPSELATSASPSTEKLSPGNKAHRQQSAEAPGEETSRRTQAVLGRARLHEFVRVSNGEVEVLTELSSELLGRQTAARRSLGRLQNEATRRGDRERLTELRRLDDHQAEIEARLEALQDRVRHLRLHEVQELFERYPPAIRELAREQKKKVKVSVEATSVAVDQRVLETLDAALLHLVRNSIDHGIEDPASREAAHKPPHGLLSLSAQPVGARVEVVVQDDGRGVDAKSVRKAAIDRGVISAAEAAKLSEADVLQLIFSPGLSTRETVTELSGRGVGLDVVQRAVAALGGTVHLMTRPGAGTTFTMTLPVSASLTEVLLVEAGQARYAIPSVQIERLIRVSQLDLRQAGERVVLELAGDALPLISLRELMLGQRIDLPQGEDLAVLVLAHGGRRLAVWVEALIGERRLVQHVLGSFVGGLKRVSGTVVSEGSEIALVVNVVEVLQNWGEGRSNIVSQDLEEAEQNRAPRVLIVEDSELTRDMLVGLASQIGLETVEAVNGRDALDRLEPVPDLILTDLDMPVLDGFGFVEALRNRPGGASVPVIVLSTRGSDEDKRKAMSAGANAYVIKAEFSETSFRELLAHFITIP